MCKKIFSWFISFCVLGSLSLRAADQVTISEFLASNIAGLVDEDNQRGDWIEIHNEGTNAVNLDGWYLTDSANNLTKWRFPATNIAAGAYMVIFADGKDRAVPGARLHTSFNLSAGGEYLALVKPDGVTIASQFSPAYPGQAPDVSYGFFSFTTNFNAVTSNAPVRWRIPTGVEGSWTNINYDDSSWAAGTNGVGFGIFAPSDSALLKTDIRAPMSNINASAYVRIPFTVATASNISLISLRMRYNDGFVASINGTEVLRMNAPNTVAFNSAATNDHASLTSEEFRLGSTALVSGTNVLAIHGLNVAANDTNFFIAAEIVLAGTEGGAPVPVYFTSPSPGAANLGGVTNPGPTIVNATNFPLVPLDYQDLTVVAKFTPTFYPLSDVVMRYRIMFSNEVEVPMFDDGAHGDGAAADGVYGATIPASASTNGQMIRWFFRASDIRGNVSRWPLFVNFTNSAEYLGTIVNPTNVTSKLPIVHLFAPAAILSPGPTSSQTGADSQAGAQVSLFFDGEFYDNIHMELRGNSTAGFNKKSHRLEFNREHPFRYSDTAARIRKTSFTADWPDPTYMRQGLTFWMATMFGAPAPFYDPMRLQLNGQFYQLANHNDVHGEEFLERIGYDPNGALYNSAGQVTPGKASTGGFDKKTRTWQNDADYTNLAVRVSETNTLAARATNIFDLFDVPQALDYMAVARWVHENDDVWANMSLYHDNDGDDLWRIVPFDMNLSWGAIFAEGDASLYTGVQATNDTHKSHPLYGGANILARSGPGGGYNRVYDSFFKVPETRQMYLRRLRTLLDTFIGPIGTPTNSTPLEQMILAKRDLIAEEANRDRAWWGWPGVGGQNNFAPGIDITNGVNQMLDQFIRARRVHFYGKHSITNAALPLFNETISPASNTVAGIPFAQPSNVVVSIGKIEFNPSSGNQGHEFVQITNPNPFAVDMSGWKLTNGVEFTFPPGTVIISNGVLYLTPDLKAGFRTRSTTPKSGQALFVLGDYQGTLDARGELLTLLDDKGRVVHTNSYVPNPSPAQNYLRITEIMYHPGPTNLGSPYGQEEFEYIELKNIGPAPLNLVGIHFTNGIDFVFQAGGPVTSLAPGQVVVLVKNAAAFTSRYGASATIAGVYSGSLDSNGERIKLDDAVGEQIMDFTYQNWFRMTDGNGFSLVIKNENAPWDTWSLQESWRPSAGYNGSAGANDGVPVVSAPILVNEVFAHSVLPDLDAIELYNPTASAVDVGNWWISDDFYSPRKYRIPAPTVIPAGGYHVFTESDFNSGGGPNTFAFSSAGDEAYVFAGDATGNITGYFDGFDFGASEPGVSFGPYVNSQTNLAFVAQKALSLGATNAGPKVGPIVISEIMYHPPDIAAFDNSLDEFIELQNISSNAVSLYDVTYPTNRWQLDDAVHFSFPTSTIPAGGFVVVVSFDPANATLLNNFRAAYRFGTNVVVVGPYTGQLDNSDETIELKKPDTSAPTNITSVLVERVHYHDLLPWDSFADGFGASLQRIVANAYGNDPTNWSAAFPNPGSAYVGGARPAITTQPSSTTAVAGRSTNTFTVVATGAGLQYQWRANGTNVFGGTNATLVLANVDLTQAGDYQVIVFNGAGGVFSSSAHLTVLSPVMFAQQPFTVNVSPGSVSSVLPGTNATLMALAIGNGPVRYQWRFEGVNIPGATNASYTITNATIPNQGSYTVVAVDDVSTTISSEIYVWVLVRPGYVQQPQPVTIVQGGTAVFSVVVTGAPPIYFRWIRGGTPYLTSSVPYLILTNVQATVSIRVAATNMATGLGGLNSSTVTLTVLPDFDGDGIADYWETNYPGFSTNNAADGQLDFDADGMINRDEFLAGTDPTDALSLLKLVLTGTNSAVLEFVAQSNVTYTVQYRTNLTSALWSNVTNITASTLVRTVQVSVPKPLPEPARFYRIVTPLVP